MKVRRIVKLSEADWYVETMSSFNKEKGRNVRQCIGGNSEIQILKFGAISLT
jgi:hypothetical protein